MVLPFQVTQVSNYLVLDQTGLLNTHFALIMPGIWSTLPVFTTIIIRGSQTRRHTIKRIRWIMYFFFVIVLFHSLSLFFTIHPPAIKTTNPPVIITADCHLIYP